VGRTLYFNGAVNGNWNNLGNWWTSGAFSTQASALPTSRDSVVLSKTCNANSGSAPTVVNFTFNDPVGNFPVLGISLTVTVTGTATFNDSADNFGTVTGNAMFNDSTINGGTVIGNATFNDSSRNNGVVSGTATFNDSACNLTGYGTAGTFVPDPPPACN
jgi:hypothetical protein